MVQLTPDGKYFSSSAMRVLTAVAAASALPDGDNCTPMPVAGLPFRRALVAYDWAPSSMRATSLRRTAEPSALARSTMSPNSWVELICPGTTTVAVTGSDGSTILAAGTATTVVGTTRTVAIPAQSVDELTAVWTGATATETTTHDVVGGVYFTAAQLRAAQGVSSITPPAGLRLELRDYQKEGLAWLQFLREQNLSGILADDMGIGKTAQTLAHLLLEKEAGRLDRPALIVLPTSLIFNWKHEAARFAPDLSVLSLHGPERKSRFAEIPGQDAQKINAAYAFGGAALQIETVSNFLGIPIDHVVIMNFTGFADFINAIGGVKIDVPEKLCANISGGKKNGGTTIRLQEGSNTLDGNDALAYARTREDTVQDPKCQLPAGYDDLDRAAAQQRVLNGIKGRLTSPLRLPYNFIKGPIIGWTAPKAFVSDMGMVAMPQLALSSIFVLGNALRLRRFAVAARNHAFDGRGIDRAHSHPQGEAQ